MLIHVYIGRYRCVIIHLINHLHEYTIVHNADTIVCIYIVFVHSGDISGPHDVSDHISVTFSHDRNFNVEFRCAHDDMVMHDINLCIYL
jgi:hypothetical protein